MWNKPAKYAFAIVCCTHMIHIRTHSIRPLACIYMRQQFCLHLSSSPKHKRRRCHHIINQAYYTFSVYKYPLNRRLCVAKTINSCMVYLCFLINWFCVHCTRCECLRVFAASSDSRFFDAHRVAFGWANHHRLSHPSIRCDWYFQMKSHPMMCFTLNVCMECSENKGFGHIFEVSCRFRFREHHILGKNFQCHPNEGGLMSLIVVLSYVSSAIIISVVFSLPLSSDYLLYSIVILLRPSTVLLLCTPRK